MGLIVFIVPIIIYFFILLFVLKYYDETKRRLKKRTLFILLFTLPFWDHIIGYAVYKYLCYTEGGLKIYKTVTDEQEQKDYWFRRNKVAGVLNKKTKEHTEIDKIIEKMNSPLSDKVVFKKDRNNVVKIGYLNYCDDKYNNTLKDDLFFTKSCTYTNSIIKKYNLKNVITIPKTPYQLYISNFDKNYNSDIFLLSIRKKEEKFLDTRTQEIFATNNTYSFNGGIFIRTFSPYNLGVSCNRVSLLHNEEKIIPNPDHKRI